MVRALGSCVKWPSTLEGEVAVEDLGILRGEGRSRKG